MTTCSATKRALFRVLMFGTPLAFLACGGGGSGGVGVDPLLDAAPAPTAPLASATDVAQYPPYGTQFTAHAYASGLRGNPGDEPLIVDDYLLRIPDAVTLRILFAEVRVGAGSRIEIECPQSGETQVLSAEEALRWGNTTAHFPGAMLQVRLVLAPHAQGSFSVHGVFDGLKEIPTKIEPHTQCGGIDDRVPSADPRSGRLNGNCTMWIEGSNNCAFSAGHCFSGMATPLTFPHVIEFNVPLSNGDSSLNPAALRDQYPIVAGTLNFVDDPSSSADRPDDWAVARLGTNNLGETAVSRQGNGFAIDTGQVFPTFPLAADPITITGYGVDLDQLTRNQVQQTEQGPWVGWSGQVASYQVDTEGANSGSPVFSDLDDRVIAIHTNAGCGDDGGGGDAGSNSGSGITHPPIVAAHTTVCSKASPTIAGPSDTTLQCNGSGGATATFNYAVSDPDGQLVFVEFRVDGTVEGSDVVAGAGTATFTFTYPLGGPYVVVATATNATGTQDSWTHQVTAQDTTPPTITCPANIVFECDGTNVVTYPSPTASDSCGSVTLTCSPPSGGVFPSGPTTVTCTATDGSGNTATCSFIVTVADTTPPTLTASVARTFLWLPLNGMVDVGLSATATDGCDSDVDIEVTVISDESNASTAPTPDAEIIGSAPSQKLRLRAQRDPIANNGRWFVIVVSTADDAGNRTTQPFVVVVPYNLTTSQINAIKALGNAAVPAITATYPPTVPPGAFLLLGPTSFN